MNLSELAKGSQVTTSENSLVVDVLQAGLRQRGNENRMLIPSTAAKRLQACNTLIQLTDIHGMFADNADSDCNASWQSSPMSTLGS